MGHGIQSISLNIVRKMCIEGMCIWLFKNSNCVSNLKSSYWVNLFMRWECIWKTVFSILYCLLWANDKFVLITVIIINELIESRNKKYFSVLRWSSVSSSYFLWLSVYILCFWSFFKCFHWLIAMPNEGINDELEYFWKERKLWLSVEDCSFIILNIVKLVCGCLFWI